MQCQIQTEQAGEHPQTSAMPETVFIFVQRTFIWRKRRRKFLLPTGKFRKLFGMGFHFSKFSPKCWIRRVQIKSNTPEAWEQVLRIRGENGRQRYTGIGPLGLMGQQKIQTSVFKEYKKNVFSCLVWPTVSTVLLRNHNLRNSTNW